MSRTSLSAFCEELLTSVPSLELELLAEASHVWVSNVSTTWNGRLARGRDAWWTTSFRQKGTEEWS